MGCTLTSMLCPGSDVSAKSVDELTPLKRAQVAACPPLAAHYSLGPKIGEGAFSVVRKGVHLHSGDVVAIKCLDLKTISSAEMANILREVSILKQLNHPHVIRCHAFYLEDHFGYIVTDLMEGGDLFDRIVDKNVYTELEAKDVVKSLLSAVAYCHEMHIVHRDLKPENILLSSRDDNAVIKIADFGLAKDDAYLITMCGSPAYVAPEVLISTKSPYDKAVDIWSIGVITYALLCGYLPFYDKNPAKMFRQIKAGIFTFPSPHWDMISPAAKDFVSKMLVVMPAKRASASLLLEDEWITKTTLKCVPLTKAMTELRKLNSRRSLRSSIIAVQSAIKLKNASSLPATIMLVIPPVYSFAIAKATLTSQICGEICPLQSTESCILYPPNFHCINSILGTCVPYNNGWTKCLWNTIDSIDISGISQDNSELIQAVDNYIAPSHTELVLKNSNKKYLLTLLDGAFLKSNLTSLWIENVDLVYHRNVFPPKLTTLVLRNTGLRRIPKEIFILEHLETLEISGQFLDTSWLSSQEQSFIRHIKCTFG
ncbi:calcium/calmodulin-dependent protein kinase [Thraustotheca clavata]|uniref:Calcium/calmodulin-dependent protein kinase n=1 Tax=Thraustotheca clavata TaxID=74557 RepID=A0A1V9Z712_9STRA|nr:calcium/calmodulin-dependent protein kinase [Thraustotheca clavata]